MRLVFAIFSNLLVVVLLTIKIQALPFEQDEYFNLRRVLGETKFDGLYDDSTNDGRIDDPKPQHISEGGNFYITDKKTGERVSKWNKTMEMNPEELGSYFQGDILQPVGTKRNGLRNMNKKWPNGVIPYTITGNFTNKQLQLIDAAMNDYSQKTCIRFRHKTNRDRDYIRILSGKTGCWSSVGRVGGPQDLNLQSPGCVYEKGTVVHELMHAVGFEHEQSRTDRDQYVSILWKNIQNGYAYAFDIEKDTDPQGVPYDYHSVMHYSSHAFSKNKDPTIIPKKPVRGELGQRKGFSASDITKINRLYRCK